MRTGRFERVRTEQRWERTLGMLLSLAVIWTPLAGYAQLQGAPHALKELEQRLAPSLPPAQVSILLDASGSMSGRYSTVREAALRFAEGLQTGETVTARAFAAVVTQPIEGSGAAAQAVLDAGLPRSPLAGLGTDLGLAISKALDDMDRPDAPKLLVLFVLTDGLHQPPSDSPYSRDFTYDPDWQELRRRGHALAARTNLTVYGLGIGGHTDIAVLRGIFPARNVELLTGDAALAGAALSRIQRNVRLMRLKTLLQEDLRTGGVKVTAAKRVADERLGLVNVQCQVSNAYRYLPVAVSELRLAGTDLSSPELRASLEAPASIELGPGERAEALLKVRAVAARPRWVLGRRTETISGAWRVMGTLAFRDREALAALDLPDTPRMPADPIQVNLAIVYGKAWWTILALAAAVLLTAVGWVRRQTLYPPPTMAGSIAVGGTVFDLQRFEKPVVTMGPPDSDIPIGTIGAPPEKVELFIKQEEDKAQLAVRTDGYHITVNGETLVGEQMLSQNDVIGFGEAEAVVLDNATTPTRVRHPALFIVAGLVTILLAIVLLMQ